MTRSTTFFARAGAISTALIAFAIYMWTRPDLLADLPWVLLAIIAWLSEGVMYYYAMRVYAEQGKLRRRDASLVWLAWGGVMVFLVLLAVWAALAPAGIPRG